MAKQRKTQGQLLRLRRSDKKRDHQQFDDQRNVTENSGSPDRQTIIDRAIEVIGDEGQAMHWLETPVCALDYTTPISLLHDAQSKADVMRVLTQLEHGAL